jgi:hypothetical protein
MAHDARVQPAIQPELTEFIQKNAPAVTTQSSVAAELIMPPPKATRSQPSDRYK